MGHIPGFEGAWTRKDHQIPCHTRRRVDKIMVVVATVCSCSIIKIISTFASGEITIAAFDLILSSLKMANDGNNMPKVKSFPSIMIEMARD